MKMAWLMYDHNNISYGQHNTKVNLFHSVSVFSPTGYFSLPTERKGSKFTNSFFQHIQMIFHLFFSRVLFCLF